MRNLTDLKSDRGLSLVEIIIAVVILGLVSISMIGGLGSSTLVARKTNAVQNKHMTLDSASEILESAPYKSCNTNNTSADYTTKNPYSSVTSATSFPSSVKISKISSYAGRDANSNDVWTECPNWASSKLPGLMQRITLTDTVTGLTRDVFKSFKADPADYGNSGSYSVASLSAISMREGTTSSNITATVTGALANATTSFYVVTGTSSGVTVALNSSTGVLTVTVSSTFISSKGGRAQVVIGAIDTTNAVYAIPAAFSISVTPAIQITSTITSPLYQIVACGFIYTGTNCATDFRTITTIPTASTFSIGSSAATPAPSTLFTINSSTGVLTYKSTTPAGTYLVPIKIVNGTATSTFVQEVQVFDKLGFPSTSITLSKATNCSNTGFKSTSSTTYCSYTLLTTAYSGSGQEPLTVSTANSNIVLNSTSYDETTGKYTLDIRLYYKQNQTCKTGTSGTVAVTITDPGYSTYTAITQPVVTFTVTC